jgi:hypothetical protein
MGFRPSLRLIRGDAVATPLLLPSACYGTWRSVRTRTQTVARRLAKGSTWAEALADDWMRVDANQALLVIDGPDPLLGHGEHFLIFGLCRAMVELALDRQIPEHRREPLVHEMLTTPWGVLSMMGQDCQSAVLTGPLEPAHMRQARMARILRAMAAHFAQFESCGPRFSDGYRRGTLDQLQPRALQFFPANLGLRPTETLRALRNGTIDKLLRERGL